MKTKTKPETMVRMDFLYRAAHLVNGVSKENTCKCKANGSSVRSQNAKRILSTHLTQLMVGIGRKAVQRASIEVKRTICKGCRNILLPGKNATISYSVTSKKKRELKFLCEQCRTQKKFPLKKLIKKKRD